MTHPGPRSGRRPAAVPSGRHPAGVPPGRRRAVKAPRRVELAHRLSTCVSTGPSRTSIERSCSMALVAPTTVGLPASPQGPGPSPAASIRVSRAGATAARPSGSTLQGSQRRSATESTAGSASSTSCVPSSCSSSRRHTGPRSSQSAHPAGEGQVEQLGQLGPDLPGLPVDGVAAEQHEVEGAGGPQHGGQGARRRQGVGARERRVADVQAGVRPPGHPSRSTSSAPGGPSVTTVQVPPLARARETPSATARRQ